MSLIVKNTSGPSLPPAAEGIYTAICVQIVDIGLQRAKFESKERDVNQVVLVWELAGETVELGEITVPRTISKTYTMSLHERSALRHDLTSWRGREFTDEELRAFDLSNILGAACLLQVVHKKTENALYAKVDSIMSLPKGTPKPAHITPLLAFDADTASEDDLEALPGWVADKIKASPTWTARSAGQPAEELEGDNGEELPF